MRLHADLMTGGAALDRARAAYRAACRTVGLLVDVQLGSGAAQRVERWPSTTTAGWWCDGPDGEYAVAAGDVVHVRPAVP